MKNNETIAFKVSEKVYLRFKQICRAQKRIPAVAYPNGRLACICLETGRDFTHSIN